MYKMLLKRRSVRKYKEKPVEEEKIESIINSVLLSPSSRNIKPCEYIIVRNKGMIEKLSKCKKHGAAFLINAPLAIIVIADNEKSDVWVEDASIASIIVQLEAESVGLKSCWIQIRNRRYNELKTSDEYIKELLKISDNFTVESIISVGYPDEERKPYDPEKMMYEKVHYEEY